MSLREIERERARRYAEWLERATPEELAREGVKHGRISLGISIGIIAICIAMYLASGEFGYLAFAIATALCVPFIVADIYLKS